MVLRFQRIDEQGPPVLQVGNKCHADDAHQQLAPSKEWVLGDITGLVGPGRGCDRNRLTIHGELSFVLWVWLTKSRMTWALMRWKQGFGSQLASWQVQTSCAWQGICSVQPAHHMSQVLSMREFCGYHGVASGSAQPGVNHTPMSSRVACRLRHAAVRHPAAQHIRGTTRRTETHRSGNRRGPMCT